MYKDGVNVIELVLTGLSEVGKKSLARSISAKAASKYKSYHCILFLMQETFFFFSGEQTFEMGGGMGMVRHYVQELLYQFLNHSVVLVHTTNSTYMHLKFFG